MERLVGDLGLEERIHFLGTRSDVPSILAASDLFILPSLWEGLPMALVEAMASELPVVATRVSGTNEVMIEGETGVVVEPGDSHMLAEGITKVLEDPIKAKEMGRAARNRVEQLYSARKQALDIVELFTANTENGSKPH